MIALVLASLFLPLSHFLLASNPPRALLVSRLGERRFSAAYSLLTLVAFGWLVVAYRHAPAAPLWTAPRWADLAALPVILASSVLVITGLTTPNPVIVRSAGLFDQPDIVRGILRVTRNPFFWGVGLFALTHVVLIGDGTACLAFGVVAFLGLAGGPVLDAKKARTQGESWRRFAAVTSDIPFLAIAQGRQRFGWREIGVWRLALGVVLFVALLGAHGVMFGGNPLGGLW
jgi:uncharacterized membrane protein